MCQVGQLVPDRSAFFVSYVKPHGAVSPKTLSRWILAVMESSGLDISAWKAHSSRAAASCFLKKSLSCGELLKLADWSEASNVYKIIYERYFKIE